MDPASLPGPGVTGGAQVQLCLLPGRGFQRRRAKPWTPVAAGCCSYPAPLHPPGPLPPRPLHPLSRVCPRLLRGRPQWPFSASSAFRKASQDRYLREARAQKPAGLSGRRVRGEEPSGAGGLLPVPAPCSLRATRASSQRPGRGAPGPPAAGLRDACGRLTCAPSRGAPARAGSGRLWGTSSKGHRTDAKKVGS